MLHKQKIFTYLYQGPIVHISSTTYHVLHVNSLSGKNMTFKSLVISAAIFVSINAQAAIVSGPDIISAPSLISDDTGATNNSQQGFNEQQSYLLAADLDIDGGSIASGTVIDSHMIFLNTASGNSYQYNKLWTFSGDILGVIQQKNDLVASNYLGHHDTTYELNFNNVGLESNESYSVLGNQLTLTMKVSEPGDWIRVITASSLVPAPVPVPAAVWLFCSALIGLFVGRRKTA